MEDEMEGNDFDDLDENGVSGVRKCNRPSRLVYSIFYLFALSWGLGGLRSG